MIENSVITSPAQTNETLIYTNDYENYKSKINRRGITVYNTSQLMQEVGRDENGQLLTWGLEQPYFYLTIMQRIEVARLCSPVFSVVSSRMNRIAAMKFNVVQLKNKEEKIYEQYKSLYDIYKERMPFTDLESAVIKAKIYNLLRENLVDLLPDLSNFYNSIMRWKKRLANKTLSQCEEIEEWLQEPTNGTTWESFIKKYVWSLQVHGATAIYKEHIDGKLENFDTLPGGTVYKMKSPYFDSSAGYIQTVPGYTSQMFFENEISYSEYLPISDYNHSMIPLECLINKVSENLLFDKLMADQADGQTPPQKIVVVTNPNNPFGDFDKPEGAPLNVDEQKRLETKLNTPRPFGVAALTFNGDRATVLDLTREGSMSYQLQRSKDIREEVGAVFGASNMEMNLTGSESTSGRSTSEMQDEITYSRGIYPIIRLLESKFKKDILPFRFGYGFGIEFESRENNEDEIQQDIIKLNAGIVTINELREKEGFPVFSGEQYNLPKSSSAGNDQMNPLFTKQIE